MNNNNNNNNNNNKAMETLPVALNKTPAKEQQQPNQKPPSSTSSSSTSSSFYRRTLPPSCTAFSSVQGRRLFASAMRHGGVRVFFVLVEQHTTQSEPAYCGLATLTVILNAMAVDPRRPWKGPWRWYHEEMLNCCVPLHEVKTSGISLPDFACLAICQGLGVRVHHPPPPPPPPSDDSNNGVPSDAVHTDDEEREETGHSLQDFRDVIRRVCVDHDDDDEEEEAEHPNIDNNDNDKAAVNELLVVSYHRGILSQTGTGHYSPVAAYDAVSDRVLILDTARFKYGAHWVSVELLYKAMQPLDPATNRPRGYVLLTHPDAIQQQQQEKQQQDCKNCGNLAVDQAQQPVSLLLRFRLTQASKLARVAYHQSKTQKHGALSSSSSTSSLLLLLSSPSSWEDWIQYWTRYGENPTYIWDLMEPQFRPLDPAALELFDDVVSLIGNLLLLHQHHQGNGFSSSADKTEEASFRDEQQRRTNDGTFDITCGKETGRLNYSRSVPLFPKEAIFILYLAMMNESDRHALVGKASASLGDPTNSETTALNPEEIQNRQLAARNQVLATAQALRVFMDQSGDGEEE